jgi:hypothetical protein
MAELTSVYDGNFRFDVVDPEWRELFDKHHLRPVRYDDMAALTEALRSSVQTVSYLRVSRHRCGQGETAFRLLSRAFRD